MSGGYPRKKYILVRLRSIAYCIKLRTLYSYTSWWNFFLRGALLLFIFRVHVYTSDVIFSINVTRQKYTYAWLTGCYCAVSSVAFRLFSLVLHLAGISVLLSRAFNRKLNVHGSLSFARVPKRRNSIVRSSIKRVYIAEERERGVILTPLILTAKRARANYGLVVVNERETENTYTHVYRRTCICWGRASISHLPGWALRATGEPSVHIRARSVCTWH